MWRFRRALSRVVGTMQDLRCRGGADVKLEVVYVLEGD